MNTKILGYDKHKIQFIIDNKCVTFNIDEQTWNCECNSTTLCKHIEKARIKLYEIKDNWEKYYRKDLIKKEYETNKMDKIKNKIFNILDYQDLIYCETTYDEKCNESVWLYSFCIYDDKSKVEKIEDELNNLKYVGATTSPNMDDSDYTIECLIDLNNENISRNDVLETVFL